MALSDEISQQANSLRDYLAPRSSSQREMGISLAMQALKMRQENQMKRQYLQQLMQSGMFGEQFGGSQPGLQQGLQQDPRAAMSMAGGGVGDVSGQQLQPIQLMQEEVPMFINKRGFSLDPISGDVRLTSSQEFNPLFTNKEDLKKKVAEKSISENVPAIQKIDTLDSVFSNIEEAWKKTIPKKKGGLLQPLAGTFSKLGSLQQRTTEEIDTKTYLDFVGGIRALLARGFGDVGNLSEFEQRAVLSAVPSIFPFEDIEQTGSDKIKQLKKVIGDIKESRKKGMALEDFQLQSNQPIEKNKKLDKETATRILQEVGNDKNKARQRAKEMGYEF